MSAGTLDFHRAEFSLFRTLADRILWDAVLIPGRLDIFQETIPEDAGEGQPHVPKDKLAGRKTSLALTESFAWSSGEKRRVHDLWKK